MNMDFTKEACQVSLCFLQQALKCHILPLGSGFLSSQNAQHFQEAFQFNGLIIPVIDQVMNYQKLQFVP